MKTLYLILLLAAIFLESCQSDSTQPNQTVNNAYAGKWLFTIVTASTSSDTVTVSSTGSVSSTQITLSSNSGTLYIATASAQIDNSASINGTISFSNVTLPFPTTISGYTGSTGNYIITLYYNNIAIGSADGSISTTTFTGSGTFTSPIFTGGWLARKL